MLCEGCRKEPVQLYTAISLACTWIVLRSLHVKNAATKVFKVYLEMMLDQFCFKGTPLVTDDTTQRRTKNRHKHKKQLNMNRKRNADDTSLPMKVS